jgi:hypothetical protein
MATSAPWAEITNPDGKSLNPQAIQDNFDKLFSSSNSTAAAMLTNIRGFYKGGATTATVALPPFSSIKGVFQGTGYIASGFGLTSFNVSMDGVATLSNTQTFYFNTAGQHMPLPLIPVVSSVGPHPAGNYTFRLNLSGITFDANDTFSGFFLLG